MEWKPDEIKGLRKKLRMSQRQFAKRLGVKRQTVACWESGIRTPNKKVIAELEKLSTKIVDSQQSVDTGVVDQKVVDMVKNVDKEVANVEGEGVDSESVDRKNVDRESVDSESVDRKNVDRKNVDSSRVDSQVDRVDNHTMQNVNPDEASKDDVNPSSTMRNAGGQGEQPKEEQLKEEQEEQHKKDTSEKKDTTSEAVKRESVNRENVNRDENVSNDRVEVTSDRPDKFDPAYITNVLELLHGKSDGIVEVRIFPNDRYLNINGHREWVGKTVSGYYTDFEKAAQDIQPFDGRGNIYFTLNPVNPDLLARAANRLKYSVSTTTKDNDILSDRWLPIDIDSVRPKDVSSTDEELKLALKKQTEIVTWLDKFSIPTITGMSGNGAHILIPLIGYPNTQETRQAKEQFIHFLSLKFSDDKVSVDSTVFNMARIWKLYGTLAVKGDNIPERPHRRAWLNIPRCDASDAFREQMPEPIDLYAMLPDILPQESEPSAEGEQRARTAVKRERPKSQVSISDQTDVPITSGADDHELIEKAKNAKNGAKFTALWDGLTDGYDSQSEADLALCCLLAFWTGGDPVAIDRLFRQSGLYREKWEREDYREKTIDAALTHTTEFYEANNGKATKVAAKEVDLLGKFDTATPADERKKTKEDFSPYFKKDTFIPKLLADDILSDNRFINVKGLLYRYENGVYRDDGEQFIAAESQNKLGNESRQNRISETVYYIKVDSYTAPELVNPSDKAHLINLKNGLYDWIEGKLLPHDPNHFSTIRIPIEYNPEATCPTVDYFLESTLPKDCIPIAEELFGYVLIPYVRFEKAFMFTGNGANGKSTFLTLLEKFVGSDNVAKIPLQELDEHRFKRADLFGKLVNLFADLDARDLQSSTYFKTIVSGDAIDAERKHQDPFYYRPFARLAFSANEIPRSPDNSYAYFRRWVIVPFPHRFEGRDADKSLADKMIEPKELSGLLNHALKGLNRLFEQEEFSESTTIKASLEDYKKQNDTVAAFVNDCCIFDSNVSVERGELYTAYSQYCEDEGYKAISRHACYGRIRAYSQVAEKGDGKKRYFTGIASAGVAVSNFPQKQS
jgi:P4 family phage/plasmid primase-like protien